MAMLNIRYEGTILPSSGACLAVALLLCKGWPEEGDIVDTTLQAIFTWVSYQLYFHPLARIPGPPHWILSRVPFVWALRRGEFAARITEIHERYGPVVRIASNEVSFIDEKAWSAFYAYRQGSSLPKSPFWYRPRVNNGTYGIMGSPNADHGRFRRALAPAFTEKAMREHEPMIQHHVNLLLSKFRNEAAKETPFDVVDWFEYAAFDIVGDLSFSKSFRTLENSEYHYLVNALRKFMNAFTQAVIPRILGLEMIWQFIVPKLSRQKQMAYNKSLNYWTHQRATQTEIPNKTDLMAYFLNRTNDKGLSIVETENAIGDLMVAGSETVASTLTAICYHLVWNSEARHTVTTEIRLAFGEERDITTERVANLPYLNAVINEAMRLCPSLPMVMPRIVTAPGMEVCGFWLPTGTLVTFCQLAAYQSPSNFKFPREFIPGRWLPDSDLKPHNPDIYHPFSIGPRDCVGKIFGLAEVRLVIAKLLWNFDISRGEADWDWYSQKAYFVWDKNPLFVNLSVAKH